MNSSLTIQSQLLATKFFVPTAVGTLISRPRLTALLDESLKHPLTLVSASAGFGKTILLSTWVQSLSASQALVAWLSLDEEDNDPLLFWIYVLSALDQQQPQRFIPLLKSLQSPQPPSLHYILTALINLVLESPEHLALLLDDYHLITEPQIHTTLSYLVEHLPPQLHIILATRTDPLLPLSLLRTRGHMLEVRTEQLRCTTEETESFLQQVMGLHLPDPIVQQVTDRTEGWLVGLQLLGLSLPEHVNPLTLLQDISGDQHYILDYLTQEVLGRQPQEIQTFLLSTCILEQLTASLCDAVMEQTGSQELLKRLEQANLFVVSLDSKRQWYRYHALFAEALCYQLEQTHPDLVLLLHHRASLWYAEHGQTNEAIIHAFKAKAWQWAADLIERKLHLLTSTAWGASHQLPLFYHWVEQLPSEVLACRPRLCLACTYLLAPIAPHPQMQAWLDAAEAALTISLTTDAPQTILSCQGRQEQENLLGEVLARQVMLQGFQEHGDAALALCQRSLSLLSADNSLVRARVVLNQLMVYYVSCANDAGASVESGRQAASLAQLAGQTTLATSITGLTALHMIGAGRLHEAEQLMSYLREKSGDLVSSAVDWPTTFQAEILREWNQLDTAYSLIQEAIAFCQRTESSPSTHYLFLGYAILLRIALSRGNFDEACLALQQFERMSMTMNQGSLYTRPYFTTIDQVRLWLACGELDRATRWAQDLDLTQRHGTPFAREREEVACVRVLLAQAKSDAALQRLEPVLQRATAGQRYGHVIEIRLLQALAYQMLNQETEALAALSKAVQQAEPEGYIRSFVDEGPSMEALLSRLREQQCKTGLTPYLDTLLLAFPQQNKAQERQSKPARESTKTQPLLNTLSEREREVLQLLAHGVSNQEIAQELVIAIDTVKRHVSHIFSKLGVNNRVQAVRQAQELGLLYEES